jgi:hypothetical protein
MKNPFALPGPETLGHHSALPSREFSPETTDYTWEDYYEEMKKTHPIRYFINHGIKEFTYSLYPIKSFLYKVMCHIHPKYKFHWLDLRDKYGPAGGYTYGYMDPQEQLGYAAFAVLVSFVEKEAPWLKTYPVREPEHSDWWYATYVELHELYNWWTVQRKAEYEADDQLYDQYKVLDKNDPNYKVLQEAWMDSRNRQDKKLNEMLVRLIAVRKGMWT